MISPEFISPSPLSFRGISWQHSIDYLPFIFHTFSPSADTLLFDGSGSLMFKLATHCSAVVTSRLGIQFSLLHCIPKREGTQPNHSAMNVCTRKFRGKKFPLLALPIPRTNLHPRCGLSNLFALGFNHARYPQNSIHVSILALPKLASTRHWLVLL